MKTFLTILFFIIPSMVFADHTETHSLIQINEQMISTFSGPEVVDILIVLSFITGILSGQR